jgi:hypothetical protein
MWTARIVDECGLVKFLRGPNCHVGRKIECDISFPFDKSISRQHSDILIEGDSLFIIDLNSKFHTYVNNELCEPNKKYFIDPKSDTLVKFGAIGSEIIIKKLNLKFCITRLEKSDRDKLKSQIKRMNSSICKIFEECTHLICNKFSATIKVLNAIVYNKPIVTMGWIDSFISCQSSLSSSFTFPSTSELVTS